MRLGALVAIRIIAESLTFVPGEHEVVWQRNLLLGALASDDIELSTRATKMLAAPHVRNPRSAL